MKLGPGLTRHSPVVAIQSIVDDMLDRRPRQQLPRRDMPAVFEYDDETVPFGVTSYTGGVK